MPSPETEHNEIALVQSAVAAEFGLKLGKLSVIEESYKGDNSEVLVGESEGKQVVVKLANDGITYPIEAAGSKLLASRGIPCAKVLAFGENVGKLNKDIIIQTMVSGTPLGRVEAAQRPSVYKEAGRILREINNIKLEGFGRLKVESEKLKGEHSAYKEAREAVKPEFEYLLEHGFINQAELEKLNQIYEEIAGIDLPQAFYLHNDFHGSHIFTDGGKVTGIIDLGNSYAGDPRKDIAIAHFFLSPKERAAFDEGYGDAVNDPMIDKYITISAAQKVEYRHKKKFTERVARALQILKEQLSKSFT